LDSKRENFQKELEELQKIYESLDENSKKDLEEVVLMIKTRFRKKIRAS